MDEKKIRRQKILICILAIAVILLLGAVIVLFIRERVEENITVEQPTPNPAPVATSTLQPASSTPAAALKSAYFTSPYPLTWTEGADKFNLTGVMLGEIDAAPDLVSASTGKPYPQGTKIYALTLVLTISTGNSSMCLPLNMRRVINESGDLAQPNTTAYDFPDVRGSGAKGYCPAPNSTFDNQNIVFEVPRTDTQFTLTTDGSSNVFFFVTVQGDGTLKVEKAPTSENG
jgi:hypothetical protein